MTRRRLLAGAAALPAAGAAAGAPAERKLLHPKALHAGDTVGLITPSSYVSDPDRLALAERTARYFGLVPKFGKNVRKRDGYLGGTIEDRVEDLHDMFRDPEVKAVFAIRGGYGASQLLDRIDYGLIRANPKILLGYSDITALHLAIQKHAGLVTFHGPVALARFTPYTQTYFHKALFDTEPMGRVTNPPNSDPLRPGTRPAHRTPRPRARTADRRQPDADLHHHGHALRNRNRRPHSVPRRRGRGAVQHRPHADSIASGGQTGRPPRASSSANARTAGRATSSRRTNRRSRPAKSWTRSSAVFARRSFPV